MTMPPQPSPDEATALRTPAETPTVATGSNPPVHLTPGMILGDRYRIVSLVGSGGMGEVYRADDIKLGQSVALKFIARHGEATRLYDEVRIGRQVTHPNVCRLYDVAEVDGRLFITMEFVDGEDLASLLRRVGRLSSEKAIAVSRDICAGLAAAHEKGVIHRDLKPANVMIDGRGRARVTDFGLALAGGAPSDTAGTPAYMAPEQLSGEAATFKSDIYALGLLLYEVFTGRRTFEAASTRDLLQRQQRGDFTRPSVITKDVPSVVERTIARCLDPNPAARPDSMEEILRDLPGADALSAAIAAGETPSPAMVAAASERGELSGRTAWTLLLLCSGALVLYGILSERTLWVPHVRVLKSPEALLDRVNDVLEATGQKLTRRDSAGLYIVDSDQLQWKGTALLTSPLKYRFRQSPQPMVGENFDHRVMQNEPAMIVPGMADVVTDAAGRLLELAIVPPLVERPAPHQAVDWTPFLRFAGLNHVTPTESTWAAPVDSDEKWAWTAVDGTRVEAAAYHGRPVWFLVIPPWAKPQDARIPANAWVIDFDTASALGAIALITAYIVGAILLALRNLRRRQGDRRGALVFATFIFATSCCAQLLRAHHPPDLRAEWAVIIKIVMFCAALSLGIWAGYIAVEPLVRRRWPRMLVSWSRLLQGRFRDPMVGRDVLIGMTFGLLMAPLWEATALAPGATPLIVPPSTLAGMQHVGYFFGFSLISAALSGLIAATILLMLRVITRSITASILIFSGVSIFIFLADVTGPLWARALFAVPVVAGALAIFFRFGLLAMSAAAVPLNILRTVVITVDTNAWYFGRTLLVLVFVGALVLYGFVVALGGKRWLPEFAFDV